MFTISGDRVDRKQEPYSRVSSRGGGDRQSRSQSGNSDLLGGNCGSRGNWKMGGNVSRGIRHSNRFTIISCPIILYITIVTVLTLVSQGRRERRSRDWSTCQGWKHQRRGEGLGIEGADFRNLISGDVMGSLFVFVFCFLR